MLMERLPIMYIAVGLLTYILVSWMFRLSIMSHVPFYHQH